LTGVAVAAVAVSVCEPAMADQIVYWTNFTGRQLVKADITTQTNTVIDTVPAAASGNPDSLIFDTVGNIVYSMYNGSPGSVRSFNTNNTDTLIHSGYSSQTVDLALDPSGLTVLVADRGNNSLDRVTLANGNNAVLNSAISTGLLMTARETCSPSSMARSISSTRPLTLSLKRELLLPTTGSLGTRLPVICSPLTAVA